MKPHLPLFKRGGKKNSEKSAAPYEVDFKRTGLAVVTVAILSVLLSIHLLPNKVSLKLGDISTEEIRACRTATYRDSSDTELRRAQAAASVGRQYDPVPNASDQAIGALKTIFHTVEDLRTAKANVTAPEAVGKIREKLGNLLGKHISDESFTMILTVDPKTLREIEDSSLQILSAAMGKEIRDDPVMMRDARKAIVADVRKLLGDSVLTTVVSEVAQDSLRANQVYSEERTLARQEKSQESVQPIYRQIMRGELVIAKGEPVLQEHIDKFEALGLRHPKVDYKSVLSLTLFVIVAVLLVVALLSKYHPDVYNSFGALLLLSILVILSTLALRIGGSMLGLNLTPEQVGFLGILWVVTASMFIAVLLNPHVAVVIASLLSLVLSLPLSNDLRYASSALITALVGIYSVANIRDRNEFLRAVGLLASTGILMVWIMGGINNDPLQQMLEGSMWAAVIAAIATTIFWFGIMPLERPFGTATHVSLLELANTNRALLRRLVMEAPGTYTHSMAVGYLAETAAEAIGADSLVARVASYYHDIGKIRRPHFFVENQNVENVHDRMNPTLSALVITSHMKDGIEIAKEFRLPRIVQDVIGQHHGTSLVQYFYQQATGEQDPSTALEQQFRYPGPKPQTKEAAIVMLADSVEAASRCLVKPTPAKIELLVNRVVAEKLRDGQLDECVLTFREVSKITDAFVRALTGTMHARIEYPDAPSTEIRKIAPNADSDTELTKDSGEDPAVEEPDTTGAAG